MGEKYIRFLRDRVIPFYYKPHIQDLLKYSRKHDRGIEPTLNVLMAVYLHECGDTFSDNQTINNPRVRAKQPDFYINEDWALNVKTLSHQLINNSEKGWLFQDIDNEEKNTDAYLILALEESWDAVNAGLKERGMVLSYPFFVGGWVGVMCWKEVKCEDA